MFWAGQVVKTPLTSKLASEFCLFAPGIIIISYHKMPAFSTGFVFDFSPHPLYNVEGHISP